MQQRFPIEMAGKVLFHSLFFSSQLGLQFQKIEFSNTMLLHFHGAHILACEHAWHEAATEGMSWAVAAVLISTVLCICCSLHLPILFPRRSVWWDCDGYILQKSWEIHPDISLQ